MKNGIATVKYTANKSSYDSFDYRKILTNTAKITNVIKTVTTRCYVRECID